MSKLTFYYSNYDYLAAPCCAIILSPIRFDDHSFMLWYVFVFTFRIVVFFLIGLRISRFPNSFLSIYYSFEFIICNICLSVPCAYPPLVAAIVVVTLVALVISDLLYTMSTLLSIFSYSSITQLFVFVSFSKWFLCFLKMIYNTIFQYVTYWILCNTLLERYI